ncbi:hypothetical protein ACHAXR_007155 [Thalassiosira sp. AJA248-18]
MSSESTDLLWNDSINELKKLVEEEGKHDEAKPVPINDAFHHFAKLYIRYTIILSDLTTCYDSSVQPQKRLDIKSTTEHVIRRVINLRYLLAKWCPPNRDVLSKSGAQAPFTWEYFDISEELKELSVPPSKVETLTPVFFKEDQAEATRRRNSTVARLLQEKLGSETSLLEEKSRSVHSIDVDVSDDERQSVEEPSHDNVMMLPNNRIETPPEQAASKIQSIVRGHFSRKKTREVRQWIDSFVGLSSFTDRAELNQHESNLVDIRHQRKQEQQYCKESYENDLHRLRDTVRGEEGFDIERELREERIQWITEHTISKNVLPDSFDGFYASNDTFSKDAKNDGNQDDSKNRAKDANEGNSKQPKKDKKSAATEEVERPVLTTHPSLLDPIRDCIHIYEERWQHRNIGPDRIQSQYHDAEMAKELIIRDQVKSELTKGVEEKLLSNILKIKAMQEFNAKKSKPKKEGKKGKGKGKKAGGKKEKPLPGAKIPGMKEMGIEEMLGVLVQNGLVYTPEEHALNDFIGGFDNVRPKLPDIMDKQERWIPDDPSAFQLRKIIMEYCILPLGSQQIKSNLQDEENIRSLLFYGPENSGKTLMVKSIASEIDALVINLSASTIGNSFGGKEGATKLIHMAFTVAKEKTYAPVVICLDNCHDFFMGKSKKGAGPSINSEMQRFQKDLIIYKNQALKKEDRVIVIGCTSMPESGDTKLLRWKGSSGKPEKQGFFERSLYFPRANHADRAMLWKEFIRRRIAGLKYHSNVPEIDYSALALLSDGYTAGKISETVGSVLSEDRLKTAPLSEHEFSRYFSKEMTRQDDGERFLLFTRQITNLDATWKSGNSSGDKKSGSDKKKKK